MMAFIFFNGLNHNVWTAIAILILIVVYPKFPCNFVGLDEGWKRFTGIDFYPALVCTFVVAFYCLHFLIHFHWTALACMNTVFSFQKWRSLEYGASRMFCAFLN